ncbi:MAG: hypothetical protein NT031_05765 [Planctomycetota bacterium]|nr:hypothetical protein [Planctomycetota bacterium]
MEGVETLRWIAVYAFVMVGLLLLRIHCKNRIIRNTRRALKASDDALTALRRRLGSLGITVEEGTGDVHIARNLQKGWYRVKADGHAAGPLNDEYRGTGGFVRGRDGFAAGGTEIVEEKGPG